MPSNVKLRLVTPAIHSFQYTGTGHKPIRLYLAKLMVNQSVNATRVVGLFLPEVCFCLLLFSSELYICTVNFLL